MDALAQAHPMLGKFDGIVGIGGVVAVEDETRQIADDAEGSREVAFAEWTTMSISAWSWLAKPSAKITSIGYNSTEIRPKPARSGQS